MDSLMSVELRNRLERLLDCSLPSTLAFDYPNLTLMTEFLLREVLDIPPTGDVVGEADGGPSDAPATPDDVDIAAVAAISSEEAERLLLEEIKHMPETEPDG
jgi:hypothetical protein